MSEQLTAEELRQLAVDLKAVADAATPGPWVRRGVNVYAEGVHMASEENAEFVIRARNGLPALADAILALMDERDALAAHDAAKLREVYAALFSEGKPYTVAGMASLIRGRISELEAQAKGGDK